MSSTEEIIAALSRGDEVSVEAAGESMSPTLRRGERVNVQPWRARLGEVVLIRGRDGFVLHRMIARLSLGGIGRFIHRGDAPGAQPGLCRCEDVLGVAELPPRRVTLLDQLQAISTLLRSRIRRRG